MSDRKYRQPEESRVESKPERRYGNRGQRTGGQTGQQSSHRGGHQSHQTGGGIERTGRGMEQTGGRMEQTSGRMEQTRGGTEGTGGGMGRKYGQQTSQMSQQGGGMGRQQPRGQQRRAPIRPVTVSDLAATDVVTARPDDPVTDVVRKMATEDVGAVVVVQRDRPVGIVTDRKIALALGDTPDISRMQVSDLMTEDVFTVSENTNVFDLMRKLSDRGVRRAPVVDDQGNLRGIVSLDDAIVLLAEEFHNVSQIIRKQSPRL